MKEETCETDCNWKFNFPSLPNKAICSNCFAKSELDLRTLEWMPVGKFKKEDRTDEQLSEKWV